jgi:hypothetical protein
MEVTGTTEKTRLLLIYRSGLMRIGVREPELSSMVKEYELSLPDAERDAKAYRKKFNNKIK